MSPMVFRGGGWYVGVPDWFVTVARRVRFRNSPRHHSNGLGFRTFRTCRRDVS